MKRNKEALESVAFMCGFALLSITASCQDPGAGATYHHMTAIAPIGEHIEKYIGVNGSVNGLSIEPQKEYRLQRPRKGLYMFSDSAYQSISAVKI